MSHRSIEKPSPQREGSSATSVSISVLCGCVLSKDTATNAQTIAPTTKSAYDNRVNSPAVNAMPVASSQGPTPVDDRRTRAQPREDGRMQRAFDLGIERRRQARGVDRVRLEEHHHRQSEQHAEDAGSVRIYIRNASLQPSRRRRRQGGSSTLNGPRAADQEARRRGGGAPMAGEADAGDKGRRGWRRSQRAHRRRPRPRRRQGSAAAVTCGQRRRRAHSRLRLISWVSATAGSLTIARMVSVRGSIRS